MHRCINLDAPETRIDAANMLRELSGSPKIANLEQATAELVAFFKSLLSAGMKTEAALLCWGADTFNPEPRSVQMVLNGQAKYSKNIYLGASALGKSYNLIAEALLDYAEEPKYTNTKILSTSEGHARANTWSTLVNFHRMSVIPLPGEVQAGFIGMDPINRQAGISLVAIPQGDSGKGRLQGFHPLQRSDGQGLTRVRAYIDEAEEVPIGLWDGIDNMLANEDEQGSVKVSAATNPKDISSVLAKKAEPLGGYSSIDWDFVDEWISAEGWHVTVLDAGKSENVLSKEIIFPGLQTYQGYMNLVRRGTGSEAYATFARGRYPTTSAKYNVVPPYLLDTSKGTYLWQGIPTPVGSLDPAFEEGGDEPIFTTGLYGQAVGFQRAAIEDLPPLPAEMFKTPKWVIEVQSQFPIQKGNTIHMGADIISLCKSLRIRPEWFIMDATGNATGLRDYLLLAFGAILGVKWGEKSTDKKILEESTEPANLLFPDIVTEMWFSYAEWLEFGYIRHAPLLQTAPLFSELSSRRFSRIGKTMRRVESKDAYKANNGGKSPDCFIAGTMISTPAGEIPIEELRAGDLVLTPFGETQIIFVHSVESNEITKASFSNGAELMGKGAHRVATDRGWVRLDELGIDMMIESVQSRGSWILLNSLFTPVKNIGFKALVDTIKPTARLSRRDCFIESSGQNNAGLFLKACASIIRMAIGGITKSRIWNSWRRDSTPRCTTPILQAKSDPRGWPDWRKPALRPQRGTHLQREESGTAPTESKRGRKSQERLDYANSAESNLSALNHSSESIVPIHAGVKSIVSSISKIASALCAAIRLAALSTMTRKLAIVRAEPKWGTPVNVYNLTLEDDNAYYANGILVENCADSLIMLPHLIRMRAQHNAAMLPDRPQNRDSSGRPRWREPNSVVDTINFVDVA